MFININPSFICLWYSVWNLYVLRVECVWINSLINAQISCVLSERSIRIEVCQVYGDFRIFPHGG